MCVGIVNRTARSRGGKWSGRDFGTIATFGSDSAYPMPGDQFQRAIRLRAVSRSSLTSCASSAVERRSR